MITGQPPGPLSLDSHDIGQRLQAHRRSRRVTQDAVAQELGLSRPGVAAIEAGQRRMTPELVIRLADAYGIDVSQLVRAQSAPITLTAQFRLPALEHQPAERDDLEAAVSQLEELVDQYVWLEELMDARLASLPVPPYRLGDVGEGDAAPIAEAERRRLGVGDGPVLGMRDLLEREYSMRIFEFALPNSVAGLFATSASTGPCVAINAAHPTTRKRWTLAHECGHFLSDPGRAEVTRVGSGYQRRPATERFADAFAGAWLMPRSGLERRLREIARRRDGATVADLLTLASEYGVSPQALILHLEDLRLVPSGEWDRLEASGVDVQAAAKVVRLSDDPGEYPGLPRRYVFLAVEAYTSHLITERQLGTLLGLPRLAVRELVETLLTASHETHDDLVRGRLKPTEPVRLRRSD